MPNSTKKQIKKQAAWRSCHVDLACQAKVTLGRVFLEALRSGFGQLKQDSAPRCSWFLREGRPRSKAARKGPTTSRS